MAVGDWLPSKHLELVLMVLAEWKMSLDGGGWGRVRLGNSFFLGYLECFTSPLSLWEEQLQSYVALWQGILIYNSFPWLFGIVKQQNIKHPSIM